MITALRRWIGRVVALTLLVCTLGMVRVSIDGVVADTPREARRDEIHRVE